MVHKLKIMITVGISIFMSSCAFTQGMPEDGVSCPDAPKCVSSLVSDSRHFIEPFTFNDQAIEAMQRLKQALLTEKRVTIILDHANYIRAEVRSLIFRYVDDVEFTMQPEQKLIHIRSSARMGYSDFGVNRRRIERIRTLFQKK